MSAFEFHLQFTVTSVMNKTSNFLQVAPRILPAKVQEVSVSPQTHSVKGLQLPPSVPVITALVVLQVSTVIHSRLVSAQITYSPFHHFLIFCFIM